ncbi:hypothetical protein [Paenibacillus thermotolerans]|uniref:hypothetical protein n=1 Tax=Paenibacillus thermotolerans TaxID=3027807 RepID=UPI002368507E|nr:MULTISPECIES: hypothetical protein [unclassified Paenibacillus]
MTEEELIAECKAGLDISEGSTAFDKIIKQKLRAVIGFMKSAGVSDAKMNTDLAVGVMVMGVADLWNNASGEIKFSPAFHTLLTQLAVSSLPAEGTT